MDGSLFFSDFDSVDLNVDFCFDSDEGSVAELEWNTWDEACVLEFQHASVVFSAGLSCSPSGGEYQG